MPAAAEEAAGVNALKMAMLSRSDEIMRAKPEWAPLAEFYVRFLRSRCGNVGEAAALLERHLDWRTAIRADDLRTETADEVLGCDAALVDAHIPKWLRGRDHAGRPIQWTKWKDVNVDKALASTALDKYLRYHAWKWVQTERALGDASRSANRYIGKAVVVVDLEGMYLGQCTRAFYRMVRGIAAIDGDNYPERLGQCLILNAPRAFSIVWSGVSKFIDPETQKKLRILDARSGVPLVEQLSEVIAPSQIPSDYGGTAAPLASGTWNDFDFDASATGAAHYPALSERPALSLADAPLGSVQASAGAEPPPSPSSETGSITFNTCEEEETTRDFDLEESVDSSIREMSYALEQRFSGSSGGGVGDGLHHASLAVDVDDDHWGAATAEGQARQHWRHWAARFVDEFEEGTARRGREGEKELDPLGRLGKLLSWACCDLCGVVRLPCCSVRCSNALLHASNAIWFLLGAFIVGLGFYIRFSFLWTGALIDWGLWEPLVMIFIGTAVVSMALVGTVGACSKSRLLLTIFAIANIIIGSVLVCFGGAVLIRLGASAKAIKGTLSAPSAPTSLSQEELTLIATENSFLLAIVALVASLYILAPTGAAIALRSFSPSSAGSGHEATAQGVVELRRLAVLALIFNSSHFIFGGIAIGYAGFMVSIGVEQYSPYMLLFAGFFLEFIALAGVTAWCCAARRARRFQGFLIVYAVLLILGIVLLVLFSGSAFAQIEYIASDYVDDTCVARVALQSHSVSAPRRLVSLARSCARLLVRSAVCIPASFISIYFFFPRHEADGMKRSLVVGAIICLVCAFLLAVSLVGVLYTLFVNLRRSQERYRHIVASLSEGRVSVREIAMDPAAVAPDGRRIFQAHTGSHKGSDNGFPDVDDTSSVGDAI